MSDTMHNIDIDEIVCAVDGLEQTKADELLEKAFGSIVIKAVAKMANQMELCKLPRIPEAVQIKLVFAEANVDKNEYYMKMAIILGEEPTGGTFVPYKTYNLIYSSISGLPWKILSEEIGLDRFPNSYVYRQKLEQIMDKICGHYSDTILHSSYRNSIVGGDSLKHAVTETARVSTPKFYEPKDGDAVRVFKPITMKDFSNPFPPDGYKVCTCSICEKQNVLERVEKRMYNAIVDGKSVVVTLSVPDWLQEKNFYETYKCKRTQ